MSCNPGKLNRLISIRAPISTSRSTDGQPLVTFTSSIASAVWASKEPISGRELFTQDQRWSEITTRWMMRYSSAVIPAHRLIDLGDSSAEYDIKAAIDVDDKQESLEVLAIRLT